MKFLNTKPRRIAAGVGAVVLVGAAFGACSSTSTSATKSNQQASNQQLQTYNTTQPIPQFNKSQLRQTLIDIETDQANPTPTTTFFFNMGEPNPVFSCASIGYPVPSTDELTSPDQLQAQRAYGDTVSGTTGQLDPSGVFTGDSTGTYALCLTSGGKSYAAYWEGYVFTVDGSATWNDTTHRMNNLTNPSGTFKVIGPQTAQAPAPAVPGK